MKWEVYHCKNCHHEEWQMSGVEKIWCPCKPRSKTEMEKLKPELQKIMKIEQKINMEEQK